MSGFCTEKNIGGVVVVVVMVVVVVGCYPSVLNPQSSVFCFLNPQFSILNPQSSVLKFLSQSMSFCSTVGHEKYLEGTSLKTVKDDLPLGNFIPDKKIVYKILMQNFGNKFNALREIIRQHKDIGEIPSCYSCLKEDYCGGPLCMKGVQNICN